MSLRCLIACTCFWFYWVLVCVATVDEWLHIDVKLNEINFAFYLSPGINFSSDILSGQIGILTASR